MNTVAEHFPHPMGAEVDGPLAPIGRAEGPSELPAMRTLELSNGLRVVLWPHHQIPLVHLSWITGAGALFDPPDKAGLASLATNTLVLSSRASQSSRSPETLQGRGYRPTHRTGWHTSSSGLDVSSRDTEHGIDCLFEAVAMPHLDPTGFDQARKHALAAVAPRRWGAEACADRALGAASFGQHRYGKPLAGDSDGLGRIVLSDLEGWHRARQSARASMVLVSGDFRTDEVLPRIERWVAGFTEADISSKTQRAGAPPIEPAVEAAGEPAAETAAEAVIQRGSTPRKIVLIDRPELPRTVLRLGFPIPSMGDPDWAGLWMLAMILGGSARSRLNRCLREDLGLTYQTRCILEARWHSSLLVIATAIDTARLKEALTVIAREIHQLRQTPVEEQELSYARNRSSGILLRSFQTGHGQSEQLRRWQARGFPAGYFETYLARLRSYGRQDLHRLALRHLSVEDATLVAVGPAARLEGQLSPWRDAGSPQSANISEILAAITPSDRPTVPGISRENGQELDERPIDPDLLPNERR